VPPTITSSGQEGPRLTVPQQVLHARPDDCERSSYLEVRYRVRTATDGRRVRHEITQG
jgi:hypothetical protein